MKIDFHTHGKLAKNLPFSEEYTVQLFKEAKRRGLDALCLTEHFNTQEFEKIYGYITENYPKDGDTYLVEGVRVFPGLEVDIQEGGHNLVIGRFEDILEIRRRVLPEPNEAFLPAKALFSIIKEYNVLFGAAHVYRSGCNNLALSDELIDCYDFFDLNGKDTGLMGMSNEKNIEAIAAKYNKPVLAGSDTLQYLQYGVLYNDFEKEVDTIDGLKYEIEKRAYTVEIDKGISQKVEAATLLKKALKELQKVGGRYDINLAKVKL